MLSFGRTGALVVAVAGAAALVIGCGSISVVSGTGGNSGSGGNIDIITGSGGMTAGTGGSGTGGRIAGTGGSNGQGGAAAGTGGARTGTGGTMTGAGGANDGTGGAPGTGGRIADAGVDVGVVACTAVRGCCSTDDDCNANQECAGVTCNGAGRASGVCKARPNANGNRCWTDADCANNQNNNNTCTGAVVCPCNAVCVRPDVAGTCN